MINRMTVEDSERMVELYLDMQTLYFESGLNLNRAIIIGSEMEEIRRRYSSNLLNVAYTYHNNVWFHHTIIEKNLDTDCASLIEVFYHDPEVSEETKVYLRIKWCMSNE